MVWNEVIQENPGVYLKTGVRQLQKTKVLFSENYSVSDYYLWKAASTDLVLNINKLNEKI